MRILIVDDMVKNGAVRSEFGDEIIASLPEGVAGVSTVAAGIEAINREQWDRVIVDLNLPMGLDTFDKEFNEILRSTTENLDDTTFPDALRRADGQRFGTVLKYALLDLSQFHHLSTAGVITAKICHDRGIPFTVNTGDGGHSMDGILALASNRILDPEMTADVLASEWSKREAWLKTGAKGCFKDAFTISADRSFAIGDKHDPKHWEKLFEVIKK